jgi:hypothetical protein
MLKKAKTKAARTTTEKTISPSHKRASGAVLEHRPAAPAVSMLTPLAAALRTFNRVTESLGMVTDQKLKIINLGKTKYFGSLKQLAPSLNLDSEDRLGYFLLIVELAGDLVGDTGDWLRSPNTAPIFGGKAPLDLLLAGRMEGMFTTLNYLKGSYGGWA